MPISSSIITLAFVTYCHTNTRAKGLSNNTFQTTKHTHMYTNRPTSWSAWYFTSHRSICLDDWTLLQVG